MAKIPFMKGLFCVCLCLCVHQEREREREMRLSSLFSAQAVLPECCRSEDGSSRASPDENSYYNGSPPEEKVTIPEELVSKNTLPSLTIIVQASFFV